MQEAGMSDAEISRRLNIPYLTVYSYRPEVRERKKEYWREYYGRPEVRERRKEYRREYCRRPEVRERMKEYRREYYQKNDPEFQEFLIFLEGNPNSSVKSFPSSNIYFTILKCLCEKKWRAKYRQLEKEVGENIRGPLKKLINKGIVEYKNRRYFLKEELKEKLHYLFGENS